MAFLLAIAAGVLMTAFAVAVAGFALDVFLYALGRSLATVPSSHEVIHLKPGKALTGSAWGQRAAA